MTEFIYKLVENAEEAQGAHEVRRQVFVVEQGIAEELVFQSAEESDEINIIVKNDNMVIGTARVVFPADNTAKIERMAVLKSIRGRRIGKGIISFLNRELKRRKITHIILHAQYQVSDFYKACGFIETGLPFEEAGIRHVKMEMRY
jgi:predicted GNAT family N-acyltransferase